MGVVSKELVWRVELKDWGVFFKDRGKWFGGVGWEMITGVCTARELGQEFGMGNWVGRTSQIYTCSCLRRKMKVYIVSFTYRTHL